MNFDKITSYLDSLEAEGIPSVDCIIYKDHKPVYRHMNGYADSAKTKKLQGNELYLMFSATKLITMTAILQLVEQGKVGLEHPVSEYLPAYADLKVLSEGQVKPAKKELLVKHLLSMQSGLDYDLERPGIVRVLKEKGQKATTQELVNAFIESPSSLWPQA